MPNQASLVLAADHSRALASFYGSLLGCHPQAGFSASHWRLAWPGGGLLDIYEPSRARSLPRQVGRLSLCLKRDRTDGQPLAQLQAWIDTALAAGASLDHPPRLENFGAEAWLLDPEGNRLLLLVR
jgi:hypothetical protein